MFVDHLLLSLCHKHHHKAVKAGDDPTELKAIHEEQGDGNTLLAYFTENGFLKIGYFGHMYYLLSLMMTVKS